MKRKVHIPRVLLIGAGRFGRNHLRVLRELEKERKLSLAGILVKTAKSKRAIEEEFGIPTFTAITRALIRRTDAVDIVTPPSSRLSLIRRFLPHMPVFVEKPLVETERDAKTLQAFFDKTGGTLMVGHVYRFDPILDALKEELLRQPNTPWKISGQLTKALIDDTHVDPALDFVHHVDTLDHIFGLEPVVVSKRVQGRVHELSLRYPGDIDAVLKLGWIGSERVNRLTFSGNDVHIVCDFLASMLTLSKDGKSWSLHVPKNMEPLKRELLLFLEVIRNPKGAKYPDLQTGLRVLRASGWKYVPHKSAGRKKIAIIGAGLFGTTAALELAKVHEVTVFERNNDIMTEASFVNQYRHHWGYHYPRSSETVADIRNATKDFEDAFEPAIIRDFPTYYSIAKDGSKVAAEEYLEFCKKHGLPYEVSFPGDEYVDRRKVSVNLKTMEPIYNYSKLKKIVWNRLEKKGNIALKFNSPVIGGYLTPRGKKVLMYQENGVMRHAEFDYVVNVTYANYNLFASWFNFARKKIRVDLVEAIIMRIRMPRMSFAIMDGPFTNVVPTEKKNIFTLVHIKESVLQRFVPSNGLIPPGLTYKSNARKIIEESRKRLPLLKNAKYLESRYVFRSVNADREFDDARPSDVAYHGFGCWSVLGGKIINCVTTAKLLLDDIQGDS
jgi:predicted dehydrogenase